MVLSDPRNPRRIMPNREIPMQSTIEQRNAHSETTTQRKITKVRRYVYPYYPHMTQKESCI